MSFSRLPIELREAVLSDLWPSDLASVSLVSKATLQVARPLLYHSLEFGDCYNSYDTWADTFASDLMRHLGASESDIKKAADAARERAGTAHKKYLESKARLLRVLEDCPSLRELVKMIEVHRVDVEPGVITMDSICTLLKSCRSLRQFELSDVDSLDLSRILDTLSPSVTSLRLENVEIESRILDTLSPSVTSLILRDVEIESLAPLVATLARLSSLETLSLMSVTMKSTDVQPRLNLPRLRRLVLLSSSVQPRTLSTLTIFTPSLASLSITTSSLLNVDLESLSAVTSLSLHGAQKPRGQGFDLDDIVAICRVLEASRKLNRFEWVSNASSDTSAEVFERGDLFSRLSPSIVHLVLDFNLTSSYLVRSLALDSLQSLQSLVLRRPDERVHPDAKSQRRKLKRACGDRNVRLEWRRLPGGAKYDDDEEEEEDNQ
ncbi:hypothetical protein JCM11491_007084 [Sporobolomyces phaffii]